MGGDLGGSSLKMLVAAGWALLALAPASAQTLGQNFAQGAAPAKPEMMENCPGLVAERPPFKPLARRVALNSDQVRINYIGHSTFLLESPQLVRVATDYNDYVKPPVLPDIVTMNHAHSTHYTDNPDAGIRHVLRGWAEERLLDTYDAERRPIAHSNADFSLGNRHRYTHMEQAARSGHPDRITFWLDDMDNHLHSVGQAIGFRYEVGAVIPDGTVARPLDSRHYHPNDRHGARFPHLWLDHARKHSTIDWFDQEFVLVAGPLGAAWEGAAQAAARACGLPVQFRLMPRVDYSDGFRMGQRGACLVRPDGHVAWRCPWQPEDMGGVVTAALNQLRRGGTLAA